MMKGTVIYHSSQYDIVSYGNGFAYAVHDNEAHESFFVQGEDADMFRDEWDHWPDELPTAEFIEEQFAIRS